MTGTTILYILTHYPPEKPRYLQMTVASLSVNSLSQMVPQCPLSITSTVPVKHLSAIQSSKFQVFFVCLPPILKINLSYLGGRSTLPAILGFVISRTLSLMVICLLPLIQKSCGISSRLLAEKFIICVVFRKASKVVIDIGVKTKKNK